MHRDAQAERGQVVPLVVVVLLLAAAAVLAVTRLGEQAAARGQAQAAADASALAGAQRGEAAARLVAEANHARLGRFERSGDLVQVEVVRQGHSAVATAQGVEAGQTGEPPARDPPLVSSGRADGP